MVRGRNVGNSSSNNSSLVELARIVMAMNILMLLLSSAYWSYSMIRAANNNQGNLPQHSFLSQLSPSGEGNSIAFSLGIPPGAAKPLPSIRVETEEVTRGIYGGKGDKKHLGGFTAYDPHGVSPAVWKHMVSHYGVKSLIDVGCGKGISTLWFALHGVEVLCIEGSHDAVQNTLLPDPAKQVVEHDFSRGPYWPGKTYDAVWSVEFLEHVGRNFQHNYITAFRKAALIFVTYSTWGGW
jgi:hypothetical protein